jgi:hypothetical protein
LGRYVVNIELEDGMDVVTAQKFFLIRYGLRGNDPVG